MAFLKKYEGVREKVGSVQRDESGAFLLLGLVGVLIVFMMALAMYDTGKSTREKLRTQMAVDTSAYGASIVRARSMNMIAYGNLAKRSVIGIVVGYENVWQLLDTVHNGAKVAANLPKTEETMPIIEKGKRVLKKIDKVWKNEKKDYSNFKQNIKNYYMVDLQAIDNVQRYFKEVSPWWMFMEVFIRAKRNGMTAGAIYPVPGVDLGTTYGSAGAVMDDLVKKMGGLGGRGESKLPIVKTTVKEFYRQYEGRAYLEEGGLMLKAHSDENDSSELDQYTQASVSKGGVIGLKSDETFVFGMAIGGGYTSYEGSFTKVMKSLGNLALPYIMKKYDNDSSWSYDASSIVMTYLSIKDISGKDKQRYNILSRGYYTGDVNYIVEGYWNSAASEIYYRSKGGEKPNMWHTHWSARMRPMGFDGEWDKNGVTMASMATEMIPYMVMGAGLLGTIDVKEEFSENDVEILSNMARGIDAEGVKGIGK